MCDVELNILLHRMDAMDFGTLYKIEQASRCECINCRTTNDHANMLMQWKCVKENGFAVEVLGTHFMEVYGEN